ncbi:Xylosyltransferase family GT14 [Gracilaria domingensis]|nr:Xylosyltransferase family GT14 [Gracilaria domingensis]
MFWPAARSTLLRTHHRQRVDRSVHRAAAPSEQMAPRNAATLPRQSLRQSVSKSSSAASVAMPCKVRRPFLPLSSLIFSVVLLSLCFAFLVRSPSAQQVLMRHVSSDANIAYFIQLTPETVNHLPRLYSAIYHPRNTHALHFDVRIPQSQVERSIATLRAQNPDFEKDTIIIPPRKLVYDGISMVLNTLHAMTELLKYPDWHYFINLSGHDYPLVPPYLPRQLLGSVQSIAPNFLSMSTSDRAHAVFYDRASTLFTDTSLCFPPTAPHQPLDEPVCNVLAKSKTPNPIFSKSFVPAYSGAWLIVSRQYCENATTSADARHLLVAFANMRGADEFFFATLARYNPSFNRTLASTALRKVIWVADGSHAGQHPFFVDEKLDNGSFRFFKELNNSIDFFARKFRHPDSHFMDVIDDMARDPNRIARLSTAFHWIAVKLREQVKAS